MKRDFETLPATAVLQVKVEKYMTPEQRKKFEEKQKMEEERRLRERVDNARERALEMMMGGVLEVRKEDELKKVGYRFVCSARVQHVISLCQNLV